MSAKVTIAALQAMKREGKKSVGVVAWDYQLARIADRAGFDFVSVGDSVGVNLWGRSEVTEVTLDEMLICCRAVRRGVERALVSCDMPYGPVQQGVDSAPRRCIRLIKEGGADMIKVDAAAEFPDVVRAWSAPAFRSLRSSGSPRRPRSNTAFPIARRIRRRRRRAPKRRQSSSTRRSCLKPPAPASSISPIPVRSPAPPWSRR